MLKWDSTKLAQYFDPMLAQYQATKIACLILDSNIYKYMNIALRRFLYNHGNIATKGSPEPGLCPTLIWVTSRVLHSAQYHRQHCTLQAFEEFGVLYMHNHDDKYPARPGFEPGTSRLRAPVDTNEQSGPASRSESTGIHVFVSSSQQTRGISPVLF